MVDCRSLIEFCRAFEQHRNSDHQQQRNNNNNSPSTRTKKNNSTHSSFCGDLSVFAAIDILLLFMVLTSLGVLTLPYLSFIFHQAAALVPLLSLLIRHLAYNAPPVAYAFGLFVTFILVVLIWEIISHKARKCGKPYCRGLRKAVEFDIQLESEECVKCLPPSSQDTGLQPLDIGEHYKELEAELKRMAPLNGRTVLIFRAPCGCPAGRMEVWGAKKVRRIKNCSFSYSEGLS